MSSFVRTEFEYRAPPELAARFDGPIHQVVIVGAGPCGLALAINLALQGVRSIVLDDNNTVAVGSRAICWARDTLQIFQRLGIVERVVSRGVGWNVGRVFHEDREVFNFDLTSEPGYKLPAFVNLPQFELEDLLVRRAQDFPDLIELRFQNRFERLDQRPGEVNLTVSTPDGTYELRSRYVVACDGANSAVRRHMGLNFVGNAFQEQFLIADVRLPTEFPSERWFWFNPPFHPDGSALLHRQPDNVYRLDFQLGRDVDGEIEKQPERVAARVERMLGRADFEFEWVSVYSFQCRRLERLVHDRIVFAGDAAHVVSPFGARGGNGGIQDTDNLAWKLASLLRHGTRKSLLASYDVERGRAADENIKQSTRTARFISPETPEDALVRDEVIALSSRFEFARKLINSGRLSTATFLGGDGLHTASSLHDGIRTGDAFVDAPIDDSASGTWLSELLGGKFCLLCLGSADPVLLPGVKNVRVTEQVGGLRDAAGLVRRRYGWDRHYLVRPDGYVAASFSGGSPAEITQAYDRAMGLENV